MGTVTALERIRAAPRPVQIVSVVALALIVPITFLATSGSDDHLATRGATTSPEATLPTVATEVSGTTTTTPDESTATSSRSTPSAKTSASTASTSTTIIATPYELVIDEDDPALGGRTIPDDPDPADPPPSTIAPPPWAASTFTTPGGHVVTSVGCAADTSFEAIDEFFAQRIGPVLGWDYQHVYALDEQRSLWLFQDTFLDHSGTVNTLAGARFIHNAALLQTGACFELLHSGTPERPLPFELGDGTGGTHTKWWWPMGGEVLDGRLSVFWAEMVKDPYDPDPPDGLGWHPERTYLATYDAATLERLDLRLAPDSGVAPIYGYAVSSDANFSYLFGNTFEQNMLRENGFWSGPHSATQMWLARVPRGRLDARPEYRTADGWSASSNDAQPFLTRFYAENPMQPRFLDGQWVAATAVDGYWGDRLVIDVADEPWGPWITIQDVPLEPRGGDPAMNTYHAHLLPRRDGYGSTLVTISNNARNMRRDAWYSPHRYRPDLMYFPYTPTPTTTTTSTTTTTIVAPPTTRPASTTTTTTTTTTVAPTTTSSTTTTRPPTTTSTTTVPPTASSSTTTTSTPPSTTTITMSTTTTTTTTVASPGQ